MRRTRKLWCGCLAGWLAAAGCMLAPSYTRPEAPVPADWPSGPAYERSGAEAERPAAAVGWEEFVRDPRLVRLIGLALENNRDFRLAVLNVERARALYRVQRDELLPAVRVGAEYSRRRASEHLTQPGQPRTSERYSVDLGIAAWEIDLFGRIRSLSEAALEEYLASEQARRGAQILLVSEVARAYYSLAADLKSLKLAEETLATQQEIYELIQRQFERGLIPQIDVYRAQTQVESARGEVARFQERVAQDRHALMLLVGGSVSEELWPGGLEEVQPPQDVAPGLPSEVLLNRPDVLEAESRLRAAHANIGAARAAFFPRISLTTTLGTASDELSGLFGAGAGTWSFVPQMVAPIFDARTWSAYEVAKVQRELALTSYEKAIQTAFREVADALAARGSVERQLAAQEALVEALEKTYQLALSRYQKGLDSYLAVLDAQRSLYQAQQGLVTLRLAKLASQVRLYAVLGGGWLSSSPLSAQGAERSAEQGG